MVKWHITPNIDQGSTPDLRDNQLLITFLTPIKNLVLNTNFFYGCQKGYKEQKLARVKEARNRKGKGQGKKIESDQASNKKTIFGLYACSRVKHYTFCCLICREILLEILKSLFQQS